MVMRNRHDGSHGRDDLPARIRERLHSLPRPDRPAPPPARRDGGWLGDAIILCLVFLALAVTNLVGLVMALLILRGSVGPF